MRFFDHQSNARSRTRQLVLGFVLAVVLTTAGMHLALSLPWWLLSARYPFAFLPLNIGLPLLFTLGGWWIESGNLRHGVKLAERLGARRAQPGTHFAEQRLVNIVQEVCVAAHMPVPAVMVLPRHEGINAFATGMQPADWAITVTDGALEYLTRDELQALVAHECSHLHEGDTTLNMRLMGMVSGLEMVWGFGRSLLPEEPVDVDGRLRPGVFAVIALPRLIIGVLIMAVGWLGWLAGRMLQSAVAREREYMADARAAQWVRQPAALGRVLRKIMTQQREAARTAWRPRTPWRLNLADHLLLVSDDGQMPLPDYPRARRWLATHPTLQERVRRLYGSPRGPLPLERMHPRTGEPMPAGSATPHAF